MTVIENNIYLYDEHAEIEITHNKKYYRVNVLIDKEDVNKLSKLRLTGRGYVQMSNSTLLSRVLMDCVKGDGTHVDHINGNKLDNRKDNLRVVTQSINERNLHTFSRNNTGVIGVQYRENGKYNYYRVSWRDSEGKRHTKQFNINKLGETKAFEQAKKFLKIQHSKYNYL